MDRNLKADLLALRNEVVENLRNIEGVVGRIDAKLHDEELTSCLGRCPEISSLLEQCREVRWSPEADAEQIARFIRTTSTVEERLSVIQVDRYTDAMAEMLRLARNLDRKMGEMPAKAAVEEYWDSVVPGTTDRAVEELYERKAREGDIRPPVEVDDRDVRDALDRLNRRIDQREPIQPPGQDGPRDLIDLAPSWARNVDTKSERQILAEIAAEWDDDSQAIFGQMWNRTAEKRIGIMEEVMADVAAHVRTYNYYNENVTIKSHDDARALVARYEDLERAKDMVVRVLTTFDRDTIARITERSVGTTTASGEQVEPDLENWATYYGWYDRLVGELERIAREVPQGMEVASSCLTMLRITSADREMEVFDPMVIDPGTFEWVPIRTTAEKREAFRKKARADYHMDLRRAYAWRNRAAA